MQLYFGNHTSIGHVRTANEDAFGNWLTPNGHLFVVCDGMGGHIGGAIASQSAVAAIYQTMAAQQYPSAPVAIRHCLEQANKKLRTIVSENASMQGMGTTAVVVLVQGNLAYYGHIGDSRLYLYRAGSLRRLTKDHSFVQSLVDGGHITEEEAEKHPRKNEIYRALGIGETVDPTVSQAAVTLQPGDSLVLCTDGINGMIGDRAMAAVLSEQNLSAQQQAEKLVQQADRAGGHDNATVQIIRPQTPEPVAAAVPPVMPPASGRTASIAPTTAPLSEPATTEPPPAKKPLLPIVGGIILFLALAVVVYSFFSTPSSHQLGMEPADTSTAVATPVLDTPMTPVPEPELTPAPVQSTPAPTTRVDTSSATEPETAAPAIPVPTASPKPKADTGNRKNTTVEKPTATKPASTTKPATTTPAATPAKPVTKPATDTTKNRRAKAVMPTNEL